MKNTMVLIAIALSVVMLSSDLLASQAKQMRAEANQYYDRQDYKKAFNSYLRLAKYGDRYSQRRVADMYAEGQGKKVDLEESYAWAALAAEGNESALDELNNSLLPQLENPSKAQKKAAKLVKRYGRAAQQKRVADHNKRGRVVDEGACTGSKLACPRS